MQEWPQSVQSPAGSFSHIVVRHREDGIHELTFVDSNSDAVDEWYRYQVFLNSTINRDQDVYQLFDFRAGVMPLSSALQKTRQIVAEFPNMPHHWGAIVYSNRESVLVKTAGALLNVIPGHARMTIRYFTEDDYDAAVDWLSTRP